MIIALGRTRHYDETEVVHACQRGERWAQKALYEQHFDSLLPVCGRYAANSSEAMDLLHEAFIKIFKNIKRFEAGTNLGGWMRRLTVNTCIDTYRKEVRRRTEDIDQTFDLSSDEADAVSRCGEQEILAAIQQLSPVYRTIFNLYAVEGYSHREIGERLGITESTSRSNLVKARQRLKTALLATEIHRA